jgi:hypothetical protein
MPGSRRQSLMRRLTSIAVAIAIAAVLAWRWRARPAARSAPVRGSAIAAPASTPTSVRRLPPEERRRVGDQIAQAIARAQAGSSSSSSSTGAPTTATGSAPALPDVMTIPLEQVGAPLKDALTAAIPLLADCFKQHGATAAAQMTMWSDPDTGTVIDTKALHDGSDQPLDPAVESCMRDAIDSLELPPLGQPGRLDLEYSFKFD